MIGCRKVKAGWELRIRAQPGASRTEIAGVLGEAIKIRLAAPALEGRANRALTDFLADILDVPRREISIDAGSHGRDKRVLVRAESLDLARLQSLLERGAPD